VWDDEKRGDWISGIKKRVEVRRIKSWTQARQSDAAFSFVSPFFFVAGHWTIALPALVPRPRSFPTFVSDSLTFFSSLFCTLLKTAPYTMALWREVGLQLRRAVPKASAGDVCLARPRRYVSYSAAPWRTGGAAKSSQWNTGAKNSLRTVSQEWKETRRCFSATAQAAHGHITPPKPGEE
jgi:hypothetical protein